MSRSRGRAPGSTWACPSSISDSSRESARAATITAGRHIWTSPRTSCSWTSTAATRPPGPNTGAARLQSPRASSPWHSATPFSRTIRSSWHSRSRPRDRPGRVPPEMAWEALDRLRGCERQECLAESRRVRREVRAGRESGRGLTPGPLLDVADAGAVENAEAGSALSRLEQVGQRQGGPVGEHRSPLRARRQLPQDRAHLVLTVRSPSQQMPAGQVPGETMGGRDGQPGQPGDLGDRVGAARAEGQQDRREPAHHRARRFGRCSGPERCRHGDPSSRGGPGSVAR